MDYFISWYPGDPFYSYYDDNCSILISITSVAKNWNIRKFPKFPKTLLLDSGGYRFAIAPNERLSPKKVFEKQLSILGDAQIPTFISNLDYPILNKNIPSKLKEQNINNSIAAAYELQNLAEQKKIPQYIKPLAVIQGFDIGSYQYCALELKSIGFSYFGIGSLAPIKDYYQIMERVKAVSNIVGAEKLHLFGVSDINLAKEFIKLGIHSIDSSRPVKAAAYNELLYSSPYRRYGILQNTDSLEAIPLKGSIPVERRLNKPLECTCPVCKKNPGEILIVGKRANIRSRSLHNYYHLKKAICDIE